MRFLNLLLLLTLAQVVDAQMIVDPVEPAFPMELSEDSIAVVEPYDTVMAMAPLSPRVFMPAVYTTFHDYTSFRPFERELSADSSRHWLEMANARARNEEMMMQRLMVNAPHVVHYNIATLPEAPRQYIAEVNPKEHTIEIREIMPDMPDHLTGKIEKRHWLRTFDASLRFSQAYVSPNWYQGGNNNLNFLLNLFYNVKLNPAYHPKLLFESTFQYKLGLNSAPDDSLRNYSISENLLQLNTTFGYKAANRWYYSLTAQFKTQLLNSYVTNTNTLSSAFLAPGELTAGLGMTYNYANKRKTFTFDASLSPISYNLKICVKPDSVMSHEAMNVSPNRNYSMKFGSTGECKLMWKIARNIQFNSRLFVFSDYSYIQADWENTLAMDINRFLTTQIYCHVRYDSTTPRCADEHWHKLQVKEILSFGFQYHFSSI